MLSSVLASVDSTWGRTIAAIVAVSLLTTPAQRWRAARILWWLVVSIVGLVAAVVRLLARPVLRLCATKQHPLLMEAESAWKLPEHRELEALRQAINPPPAHAHTVEGGCCFVFE